ncbi:hypothetical protein RFI_36924 [Reticulomyxa filosa]|uniref:G domain-containing protein n=1 Tax=Reticulomyxa filosa TaxID=46433 RepID=X6LGM5_RETFI|nr:hypothetical protein RFI_36924 [Reticulomyxa filosa]|eukprot:ETO00516.1 hypothetical protein RFI_36924 [Reticulomyxa filosa]
MSEVHVLLVGSTGVGKSAHIRLLTGDEKVKVSDGAKSCTMEMSIYTGSNGYNYIDTVGAEDSRNLSDEYVLNQTQRDLYKAKVKKVKIIWISNPNERESSTLQRQARYIGVIDKGIWKSVLAIVKQPGFDLESQSQGIQTAINEYRKAPGIPVPVIGYVNIDWVNGKEVGNTHTYTALYICICTFFFFFWSNPKFCSLDEQVLKKELKRACSIPTKFAI